MNRENIPTHIPKLEVGQYEYVPPGYYEIPLFLLDNVTTDPPGLPKRAIIHIDKPARILITEEGMTIEDPPL